MNGQVLEAGDGAKITAEPELRFAEGKNAEILLFDMA